MGSTPCKRQKRKTHWISCWIMQQLSSEWESHHLKQPCWQPLPLFRRKGKISLFKATKSLVFYYGSVYQSAILHCNEAPEAFNLFWLKVLHIPLQVQVPPLLWAFDEDHTQWQECPREHTVHIHNQETEKDKGMLVTPSLLRACPRGFPSRPFS